MVAGHAPEQRNIKSPLLALISDGSNVLKSFIGSNYLVMPFAFAQSGILLGSIALFGIAFLTDRCCSTLIRCKHRAVRKIMERSPQKSEEELQVSVSYGDTAREAYGKRAENIIDAALAFTQFGFCIQYFVFVLTALKTFFPASPPVLLSIIPLCVLSPCALVPSVAALGPVSMLANLAILVGFVGCLAYDATTFKGSFVGALEDAPMANWRQFPLFFSVVMSCFEGIGTVLPVESTMASSRKNYPPFLHAVIASTGLFLGVFGLAGLLRFGANHVEQIATENLPSVSFVGEAVRGCLCVAILFTYPLQIFPVLQCGERWAFHQPSRHDDDGGSVGTHRTEGPGSPLLPEGEGASSSAVANPLAVATGTTTPVSAGSGFSAVSNGGVVEPDPSLKKTARRHHNLVAATGRGPVVDALLGRALTFFGARLVTKEKGLGDDGAPGTGGSSDSREEAYYFDALELYGPWAGINLKLTVLLRFGIVLATAGIALVAADFYSYIASVVGALGATTLSFIMPSLLHLELFRGELSSWTRALDVFTAALGVTSGVVGLVVTVQDWVKAAS